MSLGIHLNSNPVNQPEGKLRFALNSVFSNTEGELGSMVNEKGTEVYSSITDNYRLIGSRTFGQNRTLLVFAGYGAEEGISIIAERNGTTLTTLIRSEDLGFSVKHQVIIRHRILNNENVFYFTDGNTRIKSINIDNLDSYLLAGYTQATANSTGVGWDTTLMNLFIDFTEPSFDVNVSNVGGVLALGTYCVAYTYLDEALNSVDYIGTTGIIPIVDEPYTSSYKSIDGGLASTNSVSTKSIEVSITNVDTSFAYLQLTLISNIDSVLSAKVVKTIPIEGGSSLSTRITGAEIGDVVPIEDILVDNIVYETAQALEIFDNSLWLYNLKEKFVDFSVLQLAALDITATWFTKEVGGDINVTTNTKSDEYYLDTRSYTLDEVYRFGIVYRFKSGYLSPVFPIASRQKDVGAYASLPVATDPNVWHNRLAPSGANWDSSTYLVGGTVNEADVRHLGLTTGDTVERWQVWNTAYRFTSPTDAAYATEGEFAYTESEELYPNDSSVWGTNAGQPIRDFKFPDATLEPLHLIDAFGTDPTNNYRSVGIKFRNVTIPAEFADEIEDYFFVRVIRDNNNSSVIDRGILSRVLEDNAAADSNEYTNYGNYLVNAGPYNSPTVTSAAAWFTLNESYQVFHGARTKFQREALGAGYIKFEKILRGTTKEYLVEDAGYESRVFLSSHLTSDDTSPDYTPSITSRVIAKQTYIDPDTRNNYMDVPFNNYYCTEGYGIQLQDEAILDIDNTIVGNVDGDVIKFYYASLKRHLVQQYGGIHTGTYMRISDLNTTECFEGDCSVGYFYFRKVYPVNNEVNMVPFIVQDKVSLAGRIYKSVVGMPYESTVNAALRHEGVGSDEIYYPKSYPTTLYDFIDREGDDLNSGGPEYPISPLVPNYYGYNEAFSQERVFKVYYPLSPTFDYNEESLGVFPQRVAVSQVSNQELSTDAMRVFLANNYRDLDKQYGEGLVIIAKNNNLYAGAEGAWFLIPVKEYQVNLDLGTAYFGTGDRLSLSPQVLQNADNMYFGTASAWCTINTPFGIFTVDERGHTIYLVGSTNADLTAQDISSWAFDELKLYFLEAFKNLVIGTEFNNFRNPANPFGIGFHAVYDPEHKRVLITKRDYLPLFESFFGEGGYCGVYNSAITYPNNGIVWNLETESFCLVKNGARIDLIEIPFTDKLYFEDKSFTLSYSFLTQSWISWHSYIPLIYFQDEDEFFSIPYKVTKAFLGAFPSYLEQGINKQIHKHNTGNYQTYYGVKYPFIVELVLKGKPGTPFTNIFYISRVSLYDEITRQWLDIPSKTFDEGIFYNSRQSSGVMPILVADSPYSSITQNTVLAKGRHTNWGLSGFRDYVTDYSIPFFTSEWASIQGNYFIDKVPNTNVSLLKDPYQLGRLTDNFLIARLYFNPEENYKISTNAILSINNQR